MLGERRVLDPGDTGDRGVRPVERRLAGERAAQRAARQHRLDRPDEVVEHAAGELRDAHGAARERGERAEGVRLRLDEPARAGSSRP